MFHLVVAANAINEAKINRPTISKPFLFLCLQLKSRFQAAQNQIKELRRRLENVELKVCVCSF